MRTMGLVMMVSLGFLAAGCDAGGDGSGACGDGFSATGGSGDFGTSEAALKVEAFLNATADLNNASLAVESDLLSACEAMATDLGIPASELEPAPGELSVKKTCSRVATEIQTILSQDLPTGVAITLVYEPAVCQVDLDVAASCAAECDVSITGEAMVECTGELVGSCSGTCSGSCTVEGTVACQGTCSGSCSGSCSGTCNGQCSAGCSATDSMGNCVGTCSGTCMGECRGSCDVAWEAKCDGSANVMANADCKAACEGRANARATCTEPTVTVSGVAVADPTAQERLDTLVATLEANFPKILKAQARVQTTLAPAIGAFVTRLTALPGAVVELGAKAAACISSALQVADLSRVRIEASVEVSVEVSGSVSTQGG